MRGLEFGALFEGMLLLILRNSRLLRRHQPNQKIIRLTRLKSECAAIGAAIRPVRCINQPRISASKKRVASPDAIAPAARTGIWTAAKNALVIMIAHHGENPEPRIPICIAPRNVNSSVIGAQRMTMTTIALFSIMSGELRRRSKVVCPSTGGSRPPK